MSILLEALKKSEERRHLGRTPDIHDAADHRPDDAVQTGMSWLPIVLLTVTAGVIFWLVWQQYRMPEMAAVSGAPEVSQRQEPASGQGAESASDQAPARRLPGQINQNAVNQPAQAARTPVDSFTATKSKAAAKSSSGQPTEAERKRQLAENFNQFSQPETAEPQSPAETSGQAQPPVPVRTPAKPPAQTAARNEARASKPPDPGPISYWEVPQNVRDGMPEFNISVMVYAENPADRFMLLNGQRLVEKDSVSGVELEEIRRDGAIFRYRNYRFLVRK